MWKPYLILGHRHAQRVYTEKGELKMRIISLLEFRMLELNANPKTIRRILQHELADETMPDKALQELIYKMNDFVLICHN
jgi:hypothetical protein